MNLKTIVHNKGFRISKVAEQKLKEKIRKFVEEEVNKSLKSATFGGRKTIKEEDL